MRTGRASLAGLLLFLVAMPPIFPQSATLDPSAPAWTRWRGPNGNGWVDDAAWNPGSISNPKKLWNARVGSGYSSVCVLGGYVYTVGMQNYNEETLVCLDGRTGTAVWSLAYPSGYTAYKGSRATPVHDNGKLYVLSLTGHAYCVDARSGKQVWDADVAGITGATRPEWAFASSALVEGGTVYFNVGTSGVALDKESGKIIWKSGTAACGYATPVPFTYKGTRYLVMFGSKQVTVVEASSGKEFARVPWETDYDVNVGDPLVVGDTVFIASNYGTGCALFRIGDRSLTSLWSRKEVLSHFSSAVYVDGYYYCNSGFAGEGAGSFFCLNAKDGSIAWKQDLGVGSVLGAGSRLLLTLETGDLVVAQASPKGYTEIARAVKVVPRLCWTAPVLVGGRVYLRGDKGNVICVDASK
jgi:outer membrane protein assembly factor BamB